MKNLNRQFQLFSHSVTKSGKGKCGDAFAVLELTEENLLLLAVADGVSSCPCDWLASQTACETVMKVFAETVGGSLAGRMKIAAGKAHQAVKSVSGACRGMLTSLTLAVWEIGVDRIHFLNVGDSRIYLGTEYDPRQITVDDMISVPVIRDGEILLNAGVPVFRRGVTRSLGQSDLLAFEVQTAEFIGRDLLILVSDGICKNEAFTAEFGDIFTAGNVSEKLQTLVRDNSEKNKDDATLVVLWRTERDETARADYKECLAAKTDFRQKNLGGRNTIEFLEADLVAELSKNSNEKVNELLDYAELYRLRFSRSFLSEFLSAVIKQGTDRRLVMRLRDLIRIAGDH